MIKLVSQVTNLILQWKYPSLQKFLLRLGEFSFFLFGQNELLHFLIEDLLDIPDALFMLYFILV